MELSIIYYIKFDRVFTHKKKEFEYFYNEVAYTLNYRVGANEDVVSLNLTEKCTHIL